MEAAGEYVVTNWETLGTIIDGGKRVAAIPGPAGSPGVGVDEIEILGAME